MTERGSMLPLFIGVSAFSLVLALGATQICFSFIFRQAMQESADQVALVAKSRGLTSAKPVAELLFKLDPNLSLGEFRIMDSKTVEIRVCGTWNKWLELPIYPASTQVCLESAAR